MEVHHESGKSALEIVLTKVHAGGKFDHNAYKVSGGLHGVGVTAVNALSEWLEAEVRRDGQVWSQSFEKGVATGPVRPLGPAKSTGTKVTFLPDAEIFPRIDFDADILEKRLRELSLPQPRRADPPGSTSAAPSRGTSSSTRRRAWPSSWRS